MHSEGGLNVVAVMGEITDAIRLTLAVRSAVALPDGGVRFSVRGGLKVIVRASSSFRLYDVTIVHGTAEVGSWPGVYPDSLGAVVRQMVKTVEASR